MAATKKTPPRGGSDTMKARGLRPIMVTVTDDEMRLLKQAAGAADKPMSHYVRAAALDRARADLK